MYTNLVLDKKNLLSIFQMKAKYIFVKNNLHTPIIDNCLYVIDYTWDIIIWDVIILNRSPRTDHLGICPWAFFFPFCRKCIFGNSFDGACVRQIFQGKPPNKSSFTEDKNK